ncbi:sugar kinase [Pseudoxanthomonas dokdonensis]|uniref:2-keto-3-deoxygluconate kinase n=1 Tax=Pseudoxanthomonas dokdonensis TaxID=344882 RepID=A0A0R0CUF1_9GAMM|nr:sugar kinase [Pseudoxanthomonas dokdonensis]KRG69550.1 2-keto-3-deoxygluconate kinase [Pseudoxanthomonas dokdonensis]
MSGKIICFGELLLRLGAPGQQLLLQTPTLDVHVGGAEANVAVSMARFGHAARMVGAVADNALGHAALGELRRHGVDVSDVQSVPGRMGLYFLTTGALHRPSEVLYDRADSAFVRAGGGRHDWPALCAGSDWLHVSGITPALGEVSANAVLEAMRAARQAGCKVSFDGNYRPSLWQSWAGDAPRLLRAIMAEADLLFASHRDMQVVLGHEVREDTAEQRFAAGARAAFEAFPHLSQMTATIRDSDSVQQQSLAGITALRDGRLLQTRRYTLAGVIDRIGTGDAFAAGVLHGAIEGMPVEQALQFGVAAGCLKHSVPGDFNWMGMADVDAFLADGGVDVKR